MKPQVPHPVYLLRTNLCGHEPAELWEFYIQLFEIEAAFKNRNHRVVGAEY